MSYRLFKLVSNSVKVIWCEKIELPFILCLFEFLQSSSCITISNEITAEKYDIYALPQTMYRRSVDITVDESNGTFSFDFLSIVFL